AVVILEPALVAADLLFHPRGTVVESGIDLDRAALGRGIQPGGQVNRGFADEFMRIARENHRTEGRPHGVFLDYGVKLGPHVNLQRLADFDLFSADLVTHVLSFSMSGPGNRSA